MYIKCPITNYIWIVSLLIGVMLYNNNDNEKALIDDTNTARWL